eukprot:TRINITY_DN6094_c0_g1_i1.p1 TRINITY_DN6094_c0_g1~~TRINITY_DN6094_c0_g1_i1.p1  ORF type:complete len:130 (-),score=18.21 TRINITY_DN6094_c0_g1_i1:171-560(-)
MSEVSKRAKKGKAAEEPIGHGGGNREHHGTSYGDWEKRQSEFAKLGPKTQWSWDEIKKHRSKESLWIVLHGRVYDVTKFVDTHPGGSESLLEQGGKDGTEEFEEFRHPPYARDLLVDYDIGIAVSLISY